MPKKQQKRDVMPFELANELRLNILSNKFRPRMKLTEADL
jgi:DNA-binding GntR family transcriptional regulator